MLTEEAVTKPPWVTLFEDDSVLVSGTVGEVEEELERWRTVIDRPITRDFEIADQNRVLGAIWSTGCSEVRRRTTAIGKHIHASAFAQ